MAKKDRDQVRARVADAIAELNLDMATVSRAIGRNHAYIFQYLNQGKPTRLPEEVRIALAAILKLPEDDLRSGFSRGNGKRPALKRVPLGQEFPPDPPTDHDIATVGSETGRRGVPVDGSAQLDVTAGMGGGGLTIVSEGVPGRAGMTFSVEHVADYWRLPRPILSALGLHAADVTILPVQGDSMETTLSEGDFVFVDTRHRLPSPDGVYALADEFGGIVVKRLEVVSGPRDEQTTVRIISDNPRHEPKERPLSDVRIIGRVLRRFGAVG